MSSTSFSILDLPSYQTGFSFFGSFISMMIPFTFPSWQLEKWSLHHIRSQWWKWNDSSLSQDTMISWQLHRCCWNQMKMKSAVSTEMEVSTRKLCYPLMLTQKSLRLPQGCVHRSSIILCLYISYIELVYFTRMYGIMITYFGAWYLF